MNELEPTLHEVKVRKTQDAQVIRHLMSGKSLTPIEAAASACRASSTGSVTEDTTFARRW